MTVAPSPKNQSREEATLSNFLDRLEADHNPYLGEVIEDQSLLEKAFARVFSSREGRLVHAYLQRRVQTRLNDPEVSEALLRHQEGQRALLALIDGFIRRGKADPYL